MNSTIIHSYSDVREYTCVKYEIPKFQKDTLYHLPKTSLLQEPNEKFETDFKITFDSKRNIEILLELEFLNDLHEINSNYHYEVFVNISCEDWRKDKNNFNDFVFKFRRISSSYSFRRKMFEKYSGSILNFSTLILRLQIHRKGPKKENRYLNDLGFLLQNNLYSDVSIQVGGKTFQAHKNILAASSTIFKAMFSHQMIENKKDIIKIDNVDPEIVQEMLMYIYTNKCKNLSNISLDLFKVADKYDLQELCNKCKEDFIFNMNTKNIFSILKIAIIHDLKDLQGQVMMYIDKNLAQMTQINFIDFAKNLDFENLTDFILLCEKYDLEDLIKRAIKHVETNITVSNVADILLMYEKHHLEDEKVHLIEFIKIHQKELAKNEKYLKLFVTHPRLMQNIFILLNS